MEVRNIGLVKIDLKKSDRQFELITFSDIDCIKGLIKNRCIIDPYFRAEPNNNFNYAGAVKPLSQELICIYVDLDRYIEMAELNAKQRYIVDRLMEGYTEDDISQMFGDRMQNIYSHVDKVCKKIKAVNDYGWYYDYMMVSQLKVPWEYKKCIRCQEYKPATSDFFHAKESSKDGLYQMCKSCRKSKRNSEVKNA